MPVLNIGDTIVTHQSERDVGNAYRVLDMTGEFVTRVHCNASNQSISCQVHQDDLYLLAAFKPPLPIKDQVCLKVKTLDERFKKRHMTRAKEQLDAYKVCKREEAREAYRRDMLARAFAEAYASHPVDDTVDVVWSSYDFSRPTIDESF